MSGIDNIAKFFDDETLSEEKMNALRTALIQELTTGIGAESLAWPLVAEGNLDMNNHDIVNVGSFAGVIQVNSTQSLATAVALVNSQGYGTILIDPGFTAVTTASGLEITADDVIIAGAHVNSIISADGSAHGLLLSGENTMIQGISFVGTAPVAIISNNTSNIIENCLFLGVGGIQIGLAGNSAAYNKVHNNGIFCSGPSGLDLMSFSNGEFNSNSILLTATNGLALRLNSGGTYHFGSCISNNNIMSIGTGGVGLIADSAISNPTTFSKKLSILGNYVYGQSKSVHIGNIGSYSFLGNTCEGDAHIESDSGTVTGNDFEDVFIYGSTNVNFSSNSTEDLTVGNNGASDDATTNTMCNSNNIAGDFVVPATGNPGLEAACANLVTGTSTTLTRLYEDGLINLFLQG